MLCLATQAQVIYSDYSDPDVCLDQNGHYWMTSSSFQCTPGLPLLHSEDGAHWELVNHALPRLVPEAHYDSIQHGNGVWAPSIRLHKDTFYIYWGDPDYGIFMVQTKDPRGAWSDPVLVVPGKGLIDPCPIWNEDGSCYLVHAWAASRSGFNSVLSVIPLSADGSRAIGTSRIVYEGQLEGNHTVEGPKFYRFGDYYYILAPAGGVEKGWQLALRSKSIYGPYESKIVYNHDGIHQGGLAGDSFFAFQERTAYGRIVHRLDVEWKDGWPMMSYDPTKNKPRPLGGDKLYQWHANSKSVTGMATPTGMRIYGHKVGDDFVNLWSVPNLYMKKFDGETFTDHLRMRVTANGKTQETGFVVMGRDYCRLSLQLEDDHFVMRQVICRKADEGGKEESVVVGSVPARYYNAGARDNYDCMITFRIQCAKGGLCSLAYSLDGKKYKSLPQTFQAREGKWIGAKYGAYSISREKNRGWADLFLTQ